MILFYNAFGERQAQSPTAFFRGESGFEHVADILLAYAFAGVCHLDYGACAFLQK